jgi:replicative DNA helicase
MTNQLPASIEAEQGILGCCILDPVQCVQKVKTSLKSPPDAFYDLRHKTIWESISELDDKRIAFDLITLQNALKDKGMLENIGGLSYLADLPNKTPSAANLAHYLDIAREKAAAREAIEVFSEGLKLLYSSQGEVGDVIGTAEGELKKISQDTAVKEFELKDHVKLYIDRLEQDWNKPTEGIGSGFKHLDRVTDFYRPGQIIVIAGATSTGKTNLSLNIAYHNLINRRPVGIMSLEMGGDELIDRLVSMHTMIDSQRIRHKEICEAEIGKITVASGFISKLPLLICDKGGMTINEIRNRAKRWRLDRGMELLIIDYIQLVRGGKKIANRHEEVGYVSTECKIMAKELGIPVIVLSQFSRDHHKQQRKPRLDDLKESGSLENDADKALLLSPLENDIIEINVAKNRNGFVTFREEDRPQLHFKKPQHRFCLIA